MPLICVVEEITFKIGVWKMMRIGSTSIVHQVFARQKSRLCKIYNLWRLGYYWLNSILNFKFPRLKIGQQISRHILRISKIRIHFLNEQELKMISLLPLGDQTTIFHYFGLSKKQLWNGSVLVLLIIFTGWKYRIMVQLSLLQLMYSWTNLVQLEL